MSLTDVAKRYSVSRASVVRWVREARQHGLSHIQTDQQPVACAA
jgi:DNA-binding transcriptional regulator LsrR (DeoR family)